jgi:hypothetical protein
MKEIKSACERRCSEGAELDAASLLGATKSNALQKNLAQKNK